MAKSRGRCRIPDSRQPALVAVVPRKKDWQILQSEKWYRIPVRTAPEGVERIRHIAFYQTRTFGAEKWSVNYYAEVDCIDTMRRCELLPDEPGHARAQELYHRIRVSELRPLPRPIPSLRWRRIVFIPTTLQRLMNAREINDLYCTSPIEDRLYDALRGVRLPAERQIFVRDAATGTGFMLDLAIFCRTGGLDVECDGRQFHAGEPARQRDRTRDNALTANGWRILRFAGREIRHDPHDCALLVRRAVRRLGGLEPLPARPAPERPQHE